MWNKASIDAGGLVASLGCGQSGTPLVVAASEGSVNTLDLLLTHGVNVEAEGQQRMTALVSAAAGGYKKCLKRLLEAGSCVVVVACCCCCRRCSHCCTTVIICSDVCC